MDPQPAPRPRLQVNLRYRSAEQKAAVEERAAAAGMTVSEFLLTCALADARQPRKKRTPAFSAISPDTFARIEGLGTWLNSLALNINSSRPFAPQAVLDALRDLYSLVHADPATAGHFAQAKGKAGELAPHPWPREQFGELARIGNNLRQIADGASFVSVPGAADTVRRFADHWARALQIEADRVAAQRGRA